MEQNDFLVGQGKGVGWPRGRAWQFGQMRDSLGGLICVAGQRPGKTCFLIPSGSKCLVYSNTQGKVILTGQVKYLQVGNLVPKV